MAWLTDVADETGWPHGVVGYADMGVDDARPMLDRLARYKLMRGVRQQFHWHENPLYRFAQTPDLCLDKTIQHNIRHLADYGWSFDLQVFTGQMSGACELADACPEITFVLQHAGMLEDLSDEGRALWRANLTELAARPNVVAKLSGFGTFIHRNDPGHIGWLIAQTVELFGAERCLWGSNFPIEKLWTDYPGLLGAHVSGTAVLSSAEQNDIFYGTASRVYRI